MSDARLRAHLAALSPEASPGPDCPSDDRIYDGASGALPPGELGPLLDHVSGCGWCSASWSIAVRTRSPAVVDLASARRRRRWVAVGVGGVLALAAGALLLLRDPDTDATYRGPAAAQLEASVPDQASLPRHGFDLAWRAPGEGYRYDLSVATGTLEEVYRVVDLGETSHRVPAAALADVPTGAALVWTVSARPGPGAPTHTGSFVVVVE